MDNKALVIEQYKELSQTHPGLVLTWKDGLGIVEGEIEFSRTFNGILIEDNYDILICLYPDYPESLPIVLETAGRIPQGFHKFNQGNLCLGALTEIKLLFRRNPRLLYYVDVFLVDYLFSYSYFSKYNRMPYGERSHKKGTLESYMDQLQVTDTKVIRAFLKLLSGDQSKYHGANPCLCNSGRKGADCHGKVILDLFKEHIPRDFQRDLHIIKREISKKV